MRRVIAREHTSSSDARSDDIVSFNTREIISGQRSGWTFTARRSTRGEGNLKYQIAR